MRLQFRRSAIGKQQDQFGELIAENFRAARHQLKVTTLCRCRRIQHVVALTDEDRAEGVATDRRQQMHGARLQRDAEHVPLEDKILDGNPAAIWT